MCYYQVFPVLVNTFSFQSQAFSSCFTQYIQANSCSSVGGTVCLLSHQAQPLAGWVLLNPNYSCSPHILGLVARTQSKSWSGDRLPGERDLCITTQLGSGLGLPALNREVGWLQAHEAQESRGQTFSSIHSDVAISLVRVLNFPSPLTTAKQTCPDWQLSFEVYPFRLLGPGLVLSVLSSPATRDWSFSACI